MNKKTLKYLLNLINNLDGYGLLVTDNSLIKSRLKELVRDELPLVGKLEAIDELNTLIKSCEEGRDGDWDCTTDEGKEGFDAMIEGLENVKNYIQ